MLTIERLIEDELFIQSPLVSSDHFIKFCKERDITVSKNDLELYEKLGILYPIVRIELPKFKEKIEYIENGTQYRVLGSLKEGEVWSGATKETYGHFWWVKDLAEEFYKEGLLWSPKDRQFITWDNFYDKVSRVGYAHQNRFEKWWAKPTLQALEAQDRATIEQLIDYTPLLFYNFAIDKKKGG